jgi:hypothetical protein
MKKLIPLFLIITNAFAGPEIAPRYDVHGLNIGWTSSPQIKNSALISCASSITGMDKSIYLTARCGDLLAYAGQKICEREMKTTLGIELEEKVSFQKCSDRQ